MNETLTVTVFAFIFIQTYMYKNGKNQGLAWTDLYEGTYYPAVSIYKNASVRLINLPVVLHVVLHVNYSRIYLHFHKALPHNFTDAWAL